MILRKRWVESCLGLEEATLPGEGILWKVWWTLQRYRGLKGKSLQAGRQEESNAGVV